MRARFNPPVATGLCQKVTQGPRERAGEMNADQNIPQRTRDLVFKNIGRPARRTSAPAKNDQLHLIPQSRIVGENVCPERSRSVFEKEDRHPIKYFNFGRDEVVVERNTEPTEIRHNSGERSSVA